MAKAYKKLYGSPSYRGDAPDPVTIEDQFTHPFQLSGYGVPVSDMQDAPYYGDTPEPNGSEQQVGVGAPTSSVTDTSTDFYNGTTPPAVRHLINPTTFMGNLPEMGRPKMQVPEYGSGQEAKNDKRNFLIGLSLVGALNPSAVASYIGSGLQGLDQNNRERQGNARQLRADELAALGRQYEADKDRYSLGQDSVNRQNAASSQYNDSAVRQQGIETSIYNNVNTVDARERIAKINSLAKVYTQKVQGILTQYKNNLGPDAVKALTESANATALELNDKGLPVSALTDAIIADTTLSDDQKQKALDAMARVKTQQAGALERTNILASSGILREKMGNESQEKQTTERLAANREIADQDDDTRRKLGILRAAVDMFGIDASGKRAANELQFRKWAKEKSLDPSTPRGKLFNTISKRILDETDRYNDTQKQISTFRIYHEDANGNPLPGNTTNKNGTILSGANRILFDRLKEQADASLASINRDSDAINGLAAGKEASVPRTPGFTTGTTANNLPPLKPFPVGSVPGTPAVVTRSPQKVNTAAIPKAVQTPANGRAQVKRSQQAPPNAAANIARTGVSKPPVTRRNTSSSSGSSVKIRSSAGSAAPRMSDAEYNRRKAAVKAAIRAMNGGG